MVFESLVVDLINKYLGDFVENLDASQLKLGIWGGDVVLNELDLKESALDDLDLPVKIKAGHVGKLTIKIPWKNLYTEPVIVTIDGLYALAVPNVGIVYNAEKDEKEKQGAKQKKMRAMEEAKKAEADKDKPKEKKKDSFAEKFATQVIKNLQIEVRNIHVRFEDKYTNPAQPFSIGVTLKELLFRTTDESWKPCIIKDTVAQIYKLVKLNALAVYWNSASQMYDGMDKVDVLKNLKSSIAEGADTNFQYLIRPISSVAHLKINPKPQDQEFTIPKIFLTIIFDDISIGLAKKQYNDVLQMLEGFERVTLMGIYKKYKPAVPFKGNVKVWWHYAYKCILEETVRRRRKMWSWEHMREHRDMKNKYREAYINKLENKKVSADIQKKLDACEAYLDVLNITVIRQQSEVEAAKRGAKRALDKKNSGWFGGLFGGKKKEDKAKGAGQEIQEQFYEQFTLDEKNKLYEAIGYQENEADPTIPKEFVAIRLVTKLNNIAIKLVDDDKKEPQLLKLQVLNVTATVAQRPAASAVKVDAKVDKFSVLGTQQDDFVPCLVTSMLKGITAQEDPTSKPLLDVQFETNPLDGHCDTGVKVMARPVQIVYDAITINHLAEFFNPPKDIQLKQLSQAAMSRYEDFKEQSASGLQHAIDLKKYTELSVDLQSSYVIVPHGGKLTKKQDVAKLILDLGHLRISTEKNQSEVGGQGHTLEEVMLKAYDKFHINLDSIQLLMAHAGEDWKQARAIESSPMHILRPLTINLLLQKCLFDKDPRMAKMKVHGELPLLSLSISDHRLQEILSLVQSIPLPEGAPPEPEVDITAGPSALPNVNLTESLMAEKASSMITEEGSGAGSIVHSQSQEYLNTTDLELTFILKEINVNIAQRINKEDVPLLKLVVDNLGTEVKVRTYDLGVEAYLGGIYLQYLKIKVADKLASQLGQRLYQVTEQGPLINLVNTPTTEDDSLRLLTVKYLKANKDGPEFGSVYNKTEQKIDVKFMALELLLHLESILDLLVFVQSLQSSLVKTTPTTTEAEPKSIVEQKATEDKEKSIKKKKLQNVDPDLIDLSVQASLKMFSVSLCSEEKLITDVKIKGIDAKVTVQADKTLVSAVLKDLSVRDPCKETFYPNILEIQGSEVLALDLGIYNGNTEGDSYSDMSRVDMKVKVTLGRIKVTFLNKFVMSLLGYLNHFQEAQAKVKAAGESMAEYTQDAVSNLQETASRLSLAVTMNAPIIFVPQNSKSMTVLMIDLGNLTVSNKFEMPGQRSAHGIPAVLERMNVTLTNLKVSRATLDASQFVKSEVEILEPVNIAVNICRNIAASWCHDIPDMEIDGMLKAVKVSLSQGDFTAMMTVLDQNLSEGQGDTVAKQPEDVTIATSTGDGVEETITASSTAPVQATPQTQTSVEPWCKLKFNFCVSSLSATLYNGDSEMTSALVKRDITAALGRFELQMIGLSGHMMSNNAMVTSVILKDTIMDDLRPQTSTEAVTRMLERSGKISQDGVEVNMIDMAFRQDKDDKNIEIHMSSLYVCVCLDFLMSIADFFVKGLPAKPDSTPPTQKLPAVTDKDGQKAKEPETVPPKGEMVVLVTIDKPEIIMIEDQSNTSSNALVLDTELRFQLRQNPETMDMSANIKGLGIVSCKYNDRKAGSQILTPCDISFYSKTPTGQGAHMDISTSDLILNISPATIRTMSGIAAGLSKQDETAVVNEKIPADLWYIRKLSDCDYWFMKTVNQAPLFDVGSGVDQVLEERGEQLILNVPTIVVKLEGGVGNRTVPLLITEMVFQGEVRDWTGALAVESTLKLEVSYYNERLSVWEPLLEPVMDQGKYRRWELQLEVKKNDDIELGLDDEDETENLVLPPAKMAINVKSTDPLQLTMSKACLESLSNLSKAFGDAYALVEPTQKAGEVKAPYVINNVTGVDFVLKLDNTFQMPSDATNSKVKLPSNTILPLHDKAGPKLRRQASILKAAQESNEKQIIFQVDNFQTTKEVMIKRAEKRLFHLDKGSGDKWAVVCDTQSSCGQKTITFRSSVQVTNHLTMPVEMFFKSSTGPEMISTVEPEATFSLPLKSIYTPSAAFMFRPLIDGNYGVSEEVSWRGAENMGLKQLSCKGDSLQTMYFKARAAIEDVFYEKGEVANVKTTTFHLYPTCVLHNLLPYDVKVTVEGTSSSMDLSKGSQLTLDHACIGKHIDITIDYQGVEWFGKRQLSIDTPEMSVLTFKANQNNKELTMDLGLHYKQGPGILDVSVYSPYWMINKTDIKLMYKAGEDDSVDHEGQLKDIVMFSFKKASFFGKKKEEQESEGKKEGKNKQHKTKEWKQHGKASLKIGEGDWSDKFSLDTVGSSGTVQSKNKTRTWEVGVQILLSSSGLTKVVTFTPYYMILNTSQYTLLCKENAENSPWIEVPSKQFGGINVECQETEAAMVTTLNHYKVGMAAVLIINHTDKCDLQYNQSGIKNVHIMKPGMSGLYTWEDSVGKREMLWTCGDKKEQKNDLTQDGIGEFFYNSDTKVYWVSFLNGMQRVLLFTHDLALATIAQEAGELERIEQEITINIQGMGLSLIDNYKQQEVAFLGITSSGIIWEEKRKRFKALNVKTCHALENAFQKYSTEKALGHTPPEKVHVEKMEVNFRDMLMTKPNKRMIRRSFQDGLWIQYKTSPHQVQFHAKVNRVQIDNQVSGAVFPTILSPMPPPKSVAADSVPKPFTEISMMMRKHEHSNISQMKYFKVLIQEMQLKVDQGFLNNILELFSADQELTNEQKKEMFDKDVESTQEDLITTMGLSLASEQKMFYDYLHLSPIKVHLSFSLQGGGGDGKPTQIKANVINIFLQSVGVVLTDIQDVIFKLGYFERQHNFYNNQQMVGEMTRHYAGQAIKQMYVLVLGLDVIGNPFGLLRGLGEGVEDLFYEPYQGAIQGPEEFAEGLALGVRSLFGHAVGGAAGAVSRITGTLGKGIAALTLDDDYQKKRREAMNKRPANVGEGFARGGKGLVMGVFDGVTGIVRKPIEGAKEEGAKGFFKGVGKGLVGVVTRPTSGVIDFASSSFEGIKRIAENTTDIHRLRPPRRFHKDHIIRPYNATEAEGCAILMETEKGKYYGTDDFVAHVVVTKDGKNVFLATNKRIIFASRGEIFGSWNCEFTYTWAEIKERPKVTAKGIEVVLKEKEKKFLFGSASSKKEIHVLDKKLAEWMVVKISEIMAASGF